jgi:23S rRNA (uracil1939-C5)-methyltransferase
LTKEVIESGEYFDNRNGLGFHLPGLFDKILDINNCHLQPSPSNEIRLEIKKFAIDNFLPFFDIREKTGFLRTLMIRTTSTGEVMVLIAFLEERKETIKKLLTHLTEKFPQISSLLYVINSKMNDTISDLPVFNFYGKDFIEEKMEGLKFRIGPKSFYQTNSNQAYQLYKVARDFASLGGEETVYDLYTGTGTIANFVASKSRKVLGVDYVASAIEDAKINSQLNGISNTAFFAGDMKDIFTDSFVDENGKPDVIITDPPRAGMHESVTRVILNSGAPRVVYVSCNPATQARDLILLMEKYELKKIQPVDMFPQTHHVENVILLELNK